MSFQSRLRKTRLARKLTQQDVANKLGITRQAYGYYESEKNKREPDNETLKKLADILDVDTDYLLGRTDKPQQTTNKDTTEFNPLVEINKIIKNLGLEEGASGFFDIEKWKHLSPEDIEEIRKHFEWVAHKAKERKYNPDENDTDGL